MTKINTWSQLQPPVSGKISSLPVWQTTDDGYGQRMTEGGLEDFMEFSKRVNCGSIIAVWCFSDWWFGYLLRFEKEKSQIKWNWIPVVEEYEIFQILLNQVTCHQSSSTRQAQAWPNLQLKSWIISQTSSCTIKFWVNLKQQSQTLLIINKDSIDASTQSALKYWRMPETFFSISRFLQGETH